MDTTIDAARTGWRAWLPDGSSMPPSVWTARHRLITAIMWLHVPVLAVIGLVNGYDSRHVAADLALAVAFGGMAPPPGSRAGPAPFAGVGLVRCWSTPFHPPGARPQAHSPSFSIPPQMRRTDGQGRG